jgi:hypothetical protein
MKMDWDIFHLPILDGIGQDFRGRNIIVYNRKRSRCSPYVIKELMQSLCHQGTCELKYTNEEMVMRALAADKTATELMSKVVLVAIESPEDWQLVYSRLDQEINKLYKRWGVRGMPCFHHLSYLQYDI